jgi:Eco57I restriction-modification methylase
MIYVFAILALLLSALFGDAAKALTTRLNRVGYLATNGLFMFDDRASFLSRAYLQSMLDFEFRDYLEKGQDNVVLSKLKLWNGRDKKQSETQAEQAFVQVFFVDLWGNGLSGAGHEDNHTLAPRYAVEGGSGSGNKGAADLALGWFRGDAKAVPQVLCEFKDIRSKLDAKQNRKGANLSPVEQCLTYVKAARRHTWGNEPVQPWWGLVTDMNEFRLYWWDRAPQSYMRFTISGKNDLFETHDRLTENKDAQFDRFLFWKLLRRDSLISISGKPELWRIVERQGRREHEIEEEFYQHYKGFRDRLFKTLILYNQDFSGTKTELLRISQRLLDRFIFAFYCEDMGERMLFPPQFIRDELMDRSKKDYYEENGTDIWDWVKRLFHFMNKGGKFGQREVPEINGGLFADNDMINRLVIPNFIFAEPGQGANQASLEKKKDTLLFLSGYYNYAAKGDATQSLTLYTLGRIFEQSITELEYKVGELEGRETVAKLSKRKRDGVYYTPEKIVNYLVQETMGPWFTAAREASGWAEDDAEPAPQALKTYLAKLRSIKVVDPACGSGAFLISAFRKLLDERMVVAAVMQQRALKDDLGIGDEESKIVADILKHNIYGVDINPASVEIAKLALWLHSARVRSPLSALDGNLLCGNSLVAKDVWSMVKQTPQTEARINPFDWDGNFAEASFDIVLGNPPYVKLQNLMKVDPDVVAYLRAQRPVGTYESAQTGNFDLYLPFIEKGLRLLREGGRMAYIAPSLWTVNEYGAGLRKLLHRTRQLERWLDFKSFQVFKEAITYTALQFFTHESNDALAVAAAPDGEIGDIVFDTADSGIKFDELAPIGEWNLYKVDERAIVLSLADKHFRLDRPEVTKGITVGIQTSADHLYHMGKVDSGEYSVEMPSGEYLTTEVEDGIMRPLISGPEAKRFVEPATGRHLLFPYETASNGKVQLISAKSLQKKFPKVWRYLKLNEKELRARESSGMDHDQWYAYNYPKNLDKQELPKLIVAQTVPSMRVSADFEGKFYLNNVRVNGILPAKGTDIGFLLGVLNGEVADFVFRRIGKPKQGGWFEANKQFIAPLPIPKATPKQQADIGQRARELQDMWTSRRDVIAEVEGRLSVLPRMRYKERFLWPDLPDLRKGDLPKNLKASEHAAYLKLEHEKQVAARLDALQGFLNLRNVMTADFNKGELRLLSNGRPMLDKIYLDDAVGPLVAQYWRYVISQRKTEAKTLAQALGSYPTPNESDASRQFMQRVDALLQLNADLQTLEREMNLALFDLYGLSTDERQLIERDCAKRPLL